MPSAEALHAAIAECPAAVVMTDHAGRIVCASAALERLFGYDRDELIGQPGAILVAPGADGAPAFASGGRANGVGTGIRKDGTEFAIEDYTQGIAPRDGFALGVIVDASERVRGERLKDEFVATVSHELRTPLTSIGGALGLLISNAAGTLPEPALRLLKIAHANSQRLVRLVNSILDMERIEAGKLVFVLRPVDVRRAAEQTIEATRAFADGHGVRIRLDDASAAGELRADGDWLAQIITNLLSNAVKFSPPGGEVIVSFADRGDCIRLTVRDYGPGVPQDFRARIFEPFSQADASDARQRTGAGLGLSIVKKIVTRLQGGIGFDDAPGGGTIFHVDLPRWKHEVAPPGDPPPSPDADSLPARPLPRRYP